MTEEEFELKLSRMKDLYFHRIAFEHVSSNHEAIPFCDGSGRDACVACSEEADKCIPFPCKEATKSNFDCKDESCSCVACGWWCSCRCNAPGGNCSKTSREQMVSKKVCSCGCHNGTMKHVAPCQCYA